jgi:hypothetical protein
MFLYDQHHCLPRDCLVSFLELISREPMPRNFRAATVENLEERGGRRDLSIQCGASRRSFALISKPHFQANLTSIHYFAPNGIARSSSFGQSTSCFFSPVAEIISLWVATHARLWELTAIYLYALHIPRLTRVPQEIGRASLATVVNQRCKDSG